jgi:hypothetical protein
MTLKEKIEARIAETEKWLHSPDCASIEKLQYRSEIKFGEWVLSQMEDNGWASVEDRLPEELETVLLFSKSNGASKGYWRQFGNQLGWYEESTEYGCHDYCFDNNDVTHWQPLPPNPKQN